MSRLIVKNLPNKISEEKLLQTFSTHGLVTDVQLKYSKDGKFRHFGFVGFKTEAEALNAQKYFNGTYIGAAKVSVELCADLGDINKPRAWSKYAPDSSANIRLTRKTDTAEEEDDKKTKAKKNSEKNKEKRVAQLMEKYKDDPKFQDFLRLHKRNALDGWNVDAILNAGTEFENQNGADQESIDVDAETETNAEEKIALKDSLSDLDYLKSITIKSKTDDDSLEDGAQKTKKKKEPKNEKHFEVKLSNLPYKTKKKDIKAFLRPLKPKTIRVPMKIKGIAYAGFVTEEERKQALKKSKSFIKDKQIMVTNHESKTALLEKEKRWKQQEEALKSEESVAESGRIFIRNLAYTVTEDDLEEIFKPFGPLAEVNLPIDKFTRKPKGFAFVTFVLPENAVAAFSKLDGITFQGRLLHLIPGKSKETEDVKSSQQKSGFKEQKDKKQKAQAGSSHNWNTLFLGSSVVADLVADNYGVSKQDVLAGEGEQSAAVRLALGETQIVTETRAFLEEQGISLDAFSRPPAARSKTVVLAKNLPAFTKVEEIRDLFAKHGDLGRVVLPRSGVTAVVEFYEPTEARAAFRKLAYTKFHGTPLYLEWAPEGAFREGPGPKPSKVEEDIREDAPEGARQEEILTGEPEQNSTIFVKNLSFDTNEVGLREHFSKIGQIFSATVATKKDPKRPGQVLSMGYGFVQFMKACSVDKALKLLQHKMLDGHSLELKRSNRATASNEVQTAKKSQNIDESAASCKIICRNVPFEATEKEIRDIFKTFGTIKSVRLPKKVTGSHRGFAFVEFLSKEESKKAFEALCHSTHLYGRRLVLEWAAEEDTLESLRKKTAHHFVDSSQPSSKRLKKSDILESLGVSPDDL